MEFLFTIIAHPIVHFIVLQDFFLSLSLETTRLHFQYSPSIKEKAVLFGQDLACHFQRKAVARSKAGKQFAARKASELVA